MKSVSKPKRDRELEVGSCAHYRDPAYYTKTYARRVHDVAFYVKLAERLGGPVLEYGVGNGRIALPVASQGIEVTGVDLSRPMLDDFRARLKMQPEAIRRRIKLRQGDMRTVRLKKEAFRLVFCPFNTFLHLYTRTDVERFLARVCEHLAPRGRLVLDVSIPNPHELIRDPNRAYHSPRFVYPTGPVAYPKAPFEGETSGEAHASARPPRPASGHLVRYTERFDYDHLRQILFVQMEFLPEDSGRTSWVTPLAHRQFYPEELQALLHYNGFEVETLAGDFAGGKLEQDSDTMVVTCRRRTRRSAG